MKAKDVRPGTRLGRGRTEVSRDESSLLQPEMNEDSILPMTYQNHSKQVLGHYKNLPNQSFHLSFHVVLQ